MKNKVIDDKYIQPVLIKTVVDHLDQPALILNANKIVYANKKFEEITPAKDYLFKNFKTLLKQSDREIFDEYLASNKKSSEFTSFRFQNNLPVYVDRNCKVQIDEENIMLILFEESENRIVSQAKEKYELIFNNSTDAIFIYDIEKDKIVEVNNRALQMYGYTREEMLGKKLGSFGVNKFGFNTKLAKSYIQKAIKNKPQTFEWMAMAKSGEYFWVEVNLKKVKLANRLFVLTTIKDINARKRYETQLELRQNQLNLLNRASISLNSSLNIDSVLKNIMHEVKRILAVYGCTVWLLDESTGEMVCRETISPQRTSILGWRLKPGQGIAGWVCQNKKSLNVHDVHADKRYFSGVANVTGLDLRSIISAPIMVKGKVLGVLQAVDTSPNRFTEEELQLLEALSSTAGIALENARLYTELKASQEKYKGLQDSVPVGLFTLDLQGNLVQANPTMFKIFDTFEHDLLPNDFLMKYASVEDREIIMQAFLANKSISNHEMQLVRNKKPLWISISIRTLKDKSGKPEFYTGSVVDITATKQAELALKEEHVKAQRYLDLAGTILVSINKKGKVELINKRGCEILGYKEQEIIGKDWFRHFVPKSIKTKLKEEFNASIESGRLLNEYNEFEVITSDKKRRIIAWHNTLIKDNDGNVIAALSAGEDITLEKRLEEIKKNYMRSLELLIQNLPYGLIIYDNKQNRIKMANPEVVKILELDHNQLQDLNLWEYIETNKVNSDKTDELMLKEAADYEEVDIKVLSGVKSIRHSTFPSHEKNIVYITLEDFTERKKTRESIMELKLEKEMKAKLGHIAQELVSDISHDFKTPLSIINTNLYLLERQKDLTKVQKQFATLKKQIKKLNELTSTILEISKIDNKYELSTKIDVSKLLKEIVDDYKQMIDAKHLKLTFDCPNDVPKIAADTNGLKRVFKNLIENAIIYTPENKGIMVKVEKLPTNKLVIHCKDEGIGIKPADQKIIFERYFRSAEAQAINSKGHGLGLSIASKIVEAHNGTLTLNSKPGKGSEFTVTLPIL